MTEFVPNIALGKFAYYAGLPAANDAIIAIPIETAGLESDAILKDYDTVAAILAASNNEQTTLGRTTATAVTVTVDDTNNRTDVDCANITYIGGTGNACSRLLFCYEPDTTAPADANKIPLMVDNFVVTPAGGDITYQVSAAGFLRAS